MSIPNPLKIAQATRHLKHSDPARRRGAISLLARYLDYSPGVTELLQKAADTDPDLTVRELARAALRQADIDWAASTTSGGASSTWDCAFCGTKRITRQTCPSCGAERPAASAAGHPTPEAVAPPLAQPERTPFLFHPKNKNFLLGKSTRLHGGGCSPISIVALLAVFVCGTLIFYGTAIESWNRARSLDRDGVLTEGTVTSRRVYEDSEGSDSYFVTYSFWARERERYFSREQSVTSKSYSRWNDGSAVRIKYLPSDPAKSKLLGDSHEDNQQRITMFVAIAALAGVLIAAIIGIERRRRHQRLVRHGSILRGEIVSFTTSEDSDGDLTIRVRYRFTTPAGRTLYKQQRRQANEYKKHPHPQKSTPVAVVYVDDRHYRLL